MLLLSRCVDRLERIPHETLCTAQRTGDVESAVEAAKVLRRLESLLERGLSEPECRREALELAGVDVGHARIIAPDPYARRS